MNHTRVFVGDLSPTLTEEALIHLLSGSGEVVEVTLTEPTPLRLQRFAIVEMRTPEAARAAVKQLNGREIEGYRLFVYTMPPKTKPRERNQP
jgi:RNA recognition motif-containing protein